MFIHHNKIKAVFLLYVHIGAEKDVFAGKIVGIFDYLSIGNIEDICGGDYDVTDISAGKPSSVIITVNSSKESSAFSVYISMVSCNTLVERMNKSV